MPYKSDKLPINNPKYDKRVKLTDEDKESIRIEYETGLISQRDLAKKYSVSRRLIQFVLSPEKQAVAREQFLERQKDGRYYDRERHNEQMKRHRNHKKELYKKRIIRRGINDCFIRELIAYVSISKNIFILSSNDSILI
jgi:predicted DNA-binding protein (UPF0251 family)